jgi:hypothetical protein
MRLIWNVAPIRPDVAPVPSAGEGSKTLTEEPASEHRAGFSAREEIAGELRARRSH